MAHRSIGLASPMSDRPNRVVSLGELLAVIA